MATRTATLSSLAFLLMAASTVLHLNGESFGSPVIFCAFGLIVVAAWLYGAASILYIAPGLLLFDLIMVEPGDFWISGLTSSALFALVCAPFSFATMRWAGISTSAELSSNAKLWRIIILGGIKTSVFGLVLRSLVTSVTAADSAFQTDFLTAIPVSLTFLSEMIGLVAFMLMVTLILKLTRPHSL